MEKKILASEIKALEAAIKRTERRLTNSYIGIAVGIFIIILAAIYYFMNPEVIAGSIAVFGLGLAVLIIYYIQLRQAKKRVVELNKDLVKSKELLEKDDENEI